MTVPDPQPDRVLVVSSELPGTVLTVDVGPGDHVLVGDQLCLLESMKMEIPALAPVSGEVCGVLVRPGLGLSVAAPMFEIRADEAASAQR